MGIFYTIIFHIGTLNTLYSNIVESVTLNELKLFLRALVEVWKTISFDNKEFKNGIFSSYFHQRWVHFYNTIVEENNLFLKSFMATKINIIILPVLT